VLGERMCTHFAFNVRCSYWSFKFSAWTRAWDLECAGDGNNCCAVTRCHCVGERWSRLLCCVDLSSWGLAEWQEGEEGRSHGEKVHKVEISKLGSRGSRIFSNSRLEGVNEPWHRVGQAANDGLAEFSLDTVEVCWLLW